ncbi:MAG: hypothetical protein WBE56_16980, partial [Terracidiphilus sp.]
MRQTLSPGSKTDRKQKAGFAEFATNEHTHDNFPIAAESFCRHGSFTPLPCYRVFATLYREKPGTKTMPIERLQL